MSLKGKYTDKNCGSKVKEWVDCEGFGMGELCDDGKKCKTWREIEALIKPYMEE